MSEIVRVLVRDSEGMSIGAVSIDPEKYPVIVWQGRYFFCDTITYNEVIPIQVNSDEWFSAIRTTSTK